MSPFLLLIGLQSVNAFGTKESIHLHTIRTPDDLRKEVIAIMKDIESLRETADKSLPKDASEMEQAVHLAQQTFRDWEEEKKKKESEEMQVLVSKSLDGTNTDLEQFFRILMSSGDSIKEAQKGENDEEAFIAVVDEPSESEMSIRRHAVDEQATTKQTFIDRPSDGADDKSRTFIFPLLGDLVKEVLSIKYPIKNSRSHDEHLTFKPIESVQRSNLVDSHTDGEVFSGSVSAREYDARGLYSLKSAYWALAEINYFFRNNLIKSKYVQDVSGNLQELFDKISLNSDFQSKIDKLMTEMSKLEDLANGELNGNFPYEKEVSLILTCPIDEDEKKTDIFYFASETVEDLLTSIKLNASQENHLFAWRTFVSLVQLILPVTEGPLLPLKESVLGQSYLGTT